MEFPTVSEWGAMPLKARRIHAAWLLSEATCNANPDHEPLSPNEERALWMVAEVFGWDAQYQNRLDGLQRWNNDLRKRLSTFYRKEAKASEAR